MHSFLTERYNDPETGKKCRWVIHHNNTSNPGSSVIVTLMEIDGEELALDDPRLKVFKIPFGVLAEFVGMRVRRDKISRIEMEDTPYRHSLGLMNQGAYCVRD